MMLASLNPFLFLQRKRLGEDNEGGRGKEEALGQSPF